jgi:hypothetical protein
VGSGSASDVPQCFSHFTYVMTSGEKLVCDLQVRISERSLASMFEKRVGSLLQHSLPWQTHHLWRPSSKPVAIIAPHTLQLLSLTSLAAATVYLMTVLPVQHYRRPMKPVNTGIP